MITPVHAFDPFSPPPILEKITQCKDHLLTYLKSKFPINKVCSEEIHFVKERKNQFTFEYRLDFYDVNLILCGEFSYPEIIDPLYINLQEMPAEVKETVFSEVKKDLKQELVTLEYKSISSRNKAKECFGTPSILVFDIQFIANGRNFNYHIDSNCQYIGKGACIFSHLDNSFFVPMKEVRICPLKVEMAARKQLLSNLTNTLARDLSDHDFTLTAGDIYLFRELPKEIEALVSPFSHVGWKLEFSSSFNVVYKVNVLSLSADQDQFATFITQNP